MNHNTSRISAGQLVTLLTVSRATSLLLRPALFGTATGAREIVIGTLIFLCIVLPLTGSPLRGGLRSLKAGKVTRVLLIALFLLSCAGVLLSFIIFFQGQSEVVLHAALIVVLFAALLLYALTQGIEGIARVALIVAVLFAAVLVFTVIANAPRMRAVNLSFERAGGAAGGILRVALSHLFLCPETAAYFVLRRFVRKEDAGKPVLRRFFILQSATLCVFTVAQELVFGSFMQQQDYPLFSFALVGEFSVFQRLDALHTCGWALVIAVKLFTLSVAMLTLLDDMTKKVTHKKLNFFVSAAVATATLLLLGVFLHSAETLETVMIGLFVLAALSMAAAAFGDKHREEIPDET